MISLRYETRASRAGMAPFRRAHVYVVCESGEIRWDEL
jgi:hypothetical protein